MNHHRETHHRPQLRVLSDGQIEQIYRATLTCLERTGVNVLNAEARRLLTRAGATADGVCVRMPRGLIEEAVELAPRSFKLWDRPAAGEPGRHGRGALEVCAAALDRSEPDCVHFGPGLTTSYFLDPETGQRRRSRRGDPWSAALVCDALERFDYVMGLGLIDDVSPSLAPVYEFAEMVAGTRKPMIPWAYSVENLVDMYEIGLAVAGDEERLRQRPFFALFVTSQAPLQHTDRRMATAFWAADHGIPVVYMGGGCAGLTAPVTGAGALVISLACALSGLAAIQLKRPGAPVCIGSVPSAMDLRTARPSYGGPEMSLYSAAFSELARYLGLPFMGTAGASESKIPDVQAAIESTVQVLLSGLSSTCLVHDAGFLDCADIGSLEMLVIADEIVALARRVLRGIEVSEETLMLDLIDEVGPGGHFVATRETASRCREEIWMPRLMSREPWEDWVVGGQVTMLDRARDRVRAILTTHEPPPLPTGSEARIEAILQGAEEREAAMKGGARRED
jgi:trimethylamine--corrinoid protein Co-methyltransferase